MEKGNKTADFNECTHHEKGGITNNLNLGLA